MHFEWDNDKAQANLRKHGVSFEEAKTVFADPFARLQRDPDHCEVEDRFLIVGASRLNGRLLLVCHCYRAGDTIRLISARKAAPAERRSYWKERFHAQGI